MPHYCVNRQAQPNGDHEVHRLDMCPYPPDPANQLSLGFHNSCHTAVFQAKQTYPKSNGCYHCCRECHTT